VSFAELERQMLEEEDRGLKDDWDDLLWTLSDDDNKLDNDMEVMGLFSMTRDYGEESKMRTISEDEKQHWKNRNRRI
jgi:hypothetical protein